MATESGCEPRKGEPHEPQRYAFASRKKKPPRCRVESTVRGKRFCHFAAAALTVPPSMQMGHGGAVHSLGNSCSGTQPPQGLTQYADGSSRLPGATACMLASVGCTTQPCAVTLLKTDPPASDLRRHALLNSFCAVQYRVRRFGRRLAAGPGAGAAEASSSSHSCSLGATDSVSRPAKPLQSSSSLNPSAWSGTSGGDCEPTEITAGERRSSTRGTPGGRRALQRAYSCS